MPNKYVHPPSREKPTNDISDQQSTSIGKGINFNTIKDQIGKKSVSTKSKSKRILSNFSDVNDKYIYARMKDDLVYATPAAPNHQRRKIK